MVVKASGKVSIRDYNKVIKEITARSEKAAKISSKFVKAKFEKTLPLRVGGIIAESLYSHKVMRALSGDFSGQTNGNDLEAEFGLVGEQYLMAEDVVSHYSKPKAYRIKGPIISQTKASTRVRYELDYYDKSWEKGLLGKNYSENESAVPWLGWSFYASGDLEDEAGIMYAANNKGKRNKFFAGSRTGRAIMVEGLPAYQIPDIVKTGTRQTWLEESIARTQARVSKQIELMLREFVKNEFRKAF